MSTIATDRLTPEELTALGITDLTAGPAVVEVPDLPKEAPAKGKAGKRKRLVEDATTMPPPTEAVKKAAQEILRGPSEDPDAVPPAIMAAFVTHLLGGQPFQQTYSFFGGMVELTLQTLSVALEDRIGTATMIHDPALGDLTAANQQSILGAKIRFRNELMMAFSVKELRIGENVSSPNFTAALAVKGATLEGVRQGFLAELTPTTYSALVDAYQQFRDTYTGLLARAKTPSFWTAVSPG